MRDELPYIAGLASREIIKESNQSLEKVTRVFAADDLLAKQAGAEAD